MKSNLVALLVSIILFFPFVTAFNYDMERPTEFQNNESLTSGMMFASDRAEEVYNQASEEIFLNIIKDVTSFGPRPYGSETNEMVRDWLVSKLNNVSNNKLEVEIRGLTDSIVARLPGSLNNSVCFVIGGHYDTVEYAPGANDDGTGIAATIELARILSQYEWSLDIYFCLWNAEEIGITGSGEISGQFFSEKIDILCYYNIDMLLVQNQYAPLDERVLLYYSADYASSSRETHYTIYQDSQYWAELIQSMNYNYGIPVIKPLPHTDATSWYYSDQYSFFTAGYKGEVFFFESGFDFDTAYHTSEDTWDNPLYDYSPAESVIGSIGASISLAQNRAVGHMFSERYSLFIGAYSTKEIKFESTISTDVTLNATTSSGSALQFQVLNPFRMTLDSQTPGIENMNHYSVLSFTTDGCGQHSFIIRNQGDTTVDVEIEFAYDSDLEGDSIPDSDQDWYNRFKVDSDNDTISDMYEMQRGINRFSLDTDQDSIPDNEEIQIYGTLPYSQDSDSDSMPDAWEILYNLNPRNRDDKLEDPDKDYLSNINEFREGTNPRLNDSDSDTILDGIEISEYHTSPLSNDTDKDLMPDNWEIRYGLNPLVDDSQLDPDGDGKTNLNEYVSNENPVEALELTTSPASSNRQAFSIVILGSGISILAVVVILRTRFRSASNQVRSFGSHTLILIPFSGEPSILSWISKAPPYLFAI
jgi:hypothetical protein